MELKSIVESSSLYSKYKNSIDRESAYEVLKDRIEREKIDKAREEEYELRRKELEKERKSSRKQKSYIDKGIDSMLGTITRSIGREIARGILGSMKKDFLSFVTTVRVQEINSTSIFCVPIRKPLRKVECG